VKLFAAKNVDARSQPRCDCITKIGWPRKSTKKHKKSIQVIGRVLQSRQDGSDTYNWLPIGFDKKPRGTK